MRKSSSKILNIINEYKLASKSIDSFFNNRNDFIQFEEIAILKYLLDTITGNISSEKYGIS